MPVHLPVCEDAKKTAPRIGQGREFHTEGFDVVECFFAEDVGLDVPDSIDPSIEDRV